MHFIILSKATPVELGWNRFILEKDRNGQQLQAAFSTTEGGLSEKDSSITNTLEIINFADCAKVRPISPSCAKIVPTFGILHSASI